MTIETQLSELQNQNALLTQTVNTLVERVTGQADAIDARVNAAVLAVPEMQRTFYVTAGGDDSNDGTTAETAFASVAAAINAIPMHGGATIYLSDSRHDIDTTIEVSGKCITFKAISGRPSLYFHTFALDGVNYAHRLNATRYPASVAVYGCGISALTSDAANRESSLNCFFAVGGGGTGSNFYAENVTASLAQSRLIICSNSVASAAIYGGVYEGSAHVANAETGVMQFSVYNSSITAPLAWHVGNVTSNV